MGWGARGKVFLNIYFLSDGRDKGVIKGSRASCI
jgi:hypothetical protein